MPGLVREINIITGKETQRDYTPAELSDIAIRAAAEIANPRKSEAEILVEKIIADPKAWAAIKEELSK